jgi:GGDEF domain-containing protein
VGIEAFNEVYGFVAGDDVLRAVGLIISNVVEEAGTPNDFVGHKDVADFVLIIVPAKVEELEEKIVTRLNRAISYFYPIKDRERGFIRLKDASGKGRRVALMSAAIGWVTSDMQSFGTAGEIWDAIRLQQRTAAAVN